MQIHILNQFLDKLVSIHVNGAELRGILSLQNGTTTLYPNGIDDTYFLKPEPGSLTEALYGVAYIAGNRIDTIREIRKPQSIAPLTREERNELREKVRRDMIGETLRDSSIKQFRSENMDALHSTSQQHCELIQKLNTALEEKAPPNFILPLSQRKTRTITIYVGKTAIGTIQSIDIPKQQPNEIGAGIKVEAHRVRFDRAQVSAAFGPSKYLSVKSQRYPLQISVKEGDVEVLRCQNAWLTNIDRCYMTDDLCIMNGVDLEAESVHQKSGCSDFPCGAFLCCSVPTLK